MGSVKVYAHIYECDSITVAKNTAKRFDDSTDEYWALSLGPDVSVMFGPEQATERARELMAAAVELQKLRGGDNADRIHSSDC